MSWWQNDETFRNEKDSIKNKEDYILKQYNYKHNETCLKMSIMSKEKTK